MSIQQINGNPVTLNSTQNNGGSCINAGVRSDLASISSANTAINNVAINGKDTDPIIFNGIFNNNAQTSIIKTATDSLAGVPNNYLVSGASNSSAISVSRNVSSMITSKVSSAIIANKYDIISNMFTADFPVITNDIFGSFKNNLIVHIGNPIPITFNTNTSEEKPPTLWPCVDRGLPLDKKFCIEKHQVDTSVKSPDPEFTCPPKCLDETGVDCDCSVNPPTCVYYFQVRCKENRWIIDKDDQNEPLVYKACVSVPVPEKTEPNYLNRWLNFQNSFVKPEDDDVFLQWFFSMGDRCDPNKVADCEAINKAFTKLNYDRAALNLEFLKNNYDTKGACPKRWICIGPDDLNNANLLTEKSCLEYHKVSQEIIDSIREDFVLYDTLVECEGNCKPFEEVGEEPNGILSFRPSIITNVSVSTDYLYGEYEEIDVFDIPYTKIYSPILLGSCSITDIASLSPTVILSREVDLIKLSPPAFQTIDVVTDIFIEDSNLRVEKITIDIIQIVSVNEDSTIMETVACSPTIININSSYAPISYSVGPSNSHLYSAYDYISPEVISCVTDIFLENNCLKQRKCTIIVPNKISSNTTLVPLVKLFNTNNC